MLSAESPAPVGDGAAPLCTRRFHVGMPDVDATRALFYAAPMEWAARMLTEWRREAGIPVSEMLASRFGTPVVRTEVTYARPLRLDDEVEATLWFVRRSARSFGLVCRFTAGPGGPVASEVHITQVAVNVGDDGAFAATPLPPELIAALEAGGPGIGGDDSRAPAQS